MENPTDTTGGSPAARASQSQAFAEARTQALEQSKFALDRSASLANDALALLGQARGRLSVRISELLNELTELCSRESEDRGQGIARAETLLAELSEELARRRLGDDSRRAPAVAAMLASEAERVGSLKVAMAAVRCRERLARLRQLGEGVILP